jgi:AraC-like DNA-binding protein
VGFDHPAAQHRVRLLSRRIIVEAWRSPRMDWIRSTLRLMAAEAGQPRPGGETLVTPLADIRVIQAIRSWMDTDPAARTGCLAALQDKQIGRALLLIHRAPQADWTLPTLAAQVTLSRPAFAARFTELIGQSPMRYLTQWPMRMACTWRKEGDVPPIELAERLGYQSEAPLSRAFERVIGITPSAVRRSAASH